MCFQGLYGPFRGQKRPYSPNIEPNLESNSNNLKPLLRPDPKIADFMDKIKTDSPSRLDRLYRHAENIRHQGNFEDDFTIVEVAFG